MLGGGASGNGGGGDGGGMGGGGEGAIVICTDTSLSEAAVTLMPSAAEATA